MDRGFKGIWIPKEIWLSKDLTLQEKVFLVEIESLDNEKGCFASNKYFSEFFDISTRRVSDVIKSLENKGFLTVEMVYRKGTKQIEKRIIKTLGGYRRKLLEGIEENFHRGIEGTFQDNNTINLNNTFNKTFIPKVEKKKPKQSKKQELINYINDCEFIPELKEKYIEFIKYKIDIKKPLTSKRTINMMVNYLNKGTFTQQELVRGIEMTILKGWQGISIDYLEKLHKRNEEVSGGGVEKKKYKEINNEDLTDKDGNILF